MSAPRAFVIGNPIAHSRSPLIHGHWLRELGRAGSYERIDVPPAELEAFLRDFPRRGFVGGNVTLPHKEAVFRLVDQASPEARRLGAVNMLTIGPDGALVGHNSDGIGFVGSLDETVGAGWEAEVGTALVVGGGGAARAVVGALLDRGIARIVVANRTEAKAETVRRLDPPRIEAIPWRDLPDALHRADLVVNTTSLGMAGQPALEIELDGLRPAAIVADIVYVPLVTPFLAAARSLGHRIVPGLGMLLHQAVPGFAAWFGTVPAVTPALRALVEADVLDKA